MPVISKQDLKGIPIVKVRTTESKKGRARTALTGSVNLKENNMKVVKLPPTNNNCQRSREISVGDFPRISVVQATEEQ